MKRALITGVTGQDGSFLAELLIGKGYQVHGIIRRSSSFNTGRIEHLYADPHDASGKLVLHYGDLCDASSLRRIIERVEPAEIYNLGAQSHVRVSFDQPEYTGDIVGLGTLRMLEAIRDCDTNIRYYQAGSSEMFGSSAPPQNERTPFHPRSPYAVAKVAAHWYTVHYREAYGLHVSNGILFNHESERRGETFVTRKITRGLTRIKAGLQDKLYMGNLDARRDWGFAGDYVRAMHSMLQADTPDDYVIATGQSFTVRDFLDTAAEYLEMDWCDCVEQDARYLRPTEVEALEGDPLKAVLCLGWPRRHDFKGLVLRMVKHDHKLAKQELWTLEAGYTSRAIAV